MSNSATIARNTAFLYVRMFLKMGVELYTSRIVLKALGVNDYGIFAIVGGIVALFGFFNTAMTSATQRFLAFDIGRNNENSLRYSFNSTVVIHALIALLILIFAESIGLWAIANIVKIPANRIGAAYWVYHFSLLTFLVNVLQVPYNALIIARERMNAYAIIGILEVVLKLSAAYLLVILSYDKLKLHAVFVFVSGALVAASYRKYCLRNFSESRFQWQFDKSRFKSMISYSGWNLFGNIAVVARGQGINVLLNVFFGTVANAAYGIMIQVQGAVVTFVNSFQIAVNPQIVKRYASGKNEQMMTLIFQSSKFSFFLMLLICLPVIYNLGFILNFWLIAPPIHTETLVKLCLLVVLIDCISGPLMAGATATGKIKWYQIIVGSTVFLNLPLSYLVFLNGGAPNAFLYVAIGLSLVALVLRLLLLRQMIDLSVFLFVKNVILPIIVVSSSAVGIAELLEMFWVTTASAVDVSLFILMSSAFNLLSIFFFGLTTSEKAIIYTWVKRKTGTA